ncbi:MAG: hypothetical protein ABR499_15545 [Gemmatimonadaceae bacterium]
MITSCERRVELRQDPRDTVRSATIRGVFEPLRDPQMFAEVRVVPE